MKTKNKNKMLLKSLFVAASLFTAMSITNVSYAGNEYKFKRANEKAGGSCNSSVNYQCRDYSQESSKTISSVPSVITTSSGSNKGMQPDNKDKWNDVVLKGKPDSTFANPQTIAQESSDDYSKKVANSVRLAMYMSGAAHLLWNNGLKAQYGNDVFIDQSLKLINCKLATDVAFINGAIDSSQKDGECVTAADKDGKCIKRSTTVSIYDSKNKVFKQYTPGLLGITGANLSEAYVDGTRVEVFSTAHGNRNLATHIDRCSDNYYPDPCPAQTQLIYDDTNKAYKCSDPPPPPECSFGCGG